jgi:HK97 family phage major capsid protein
VDKLIQQLEANRAAAAERRNALLKTAEDNIAGDTKEKLDAHNGAMESLKAAGVEIAEIDDRLKDLREQRDREARAADLRKGDPADVDGRAKVTVGAEPMQYGEGSGHSYFLDQARVHFRKGDGDGGWQQATQRQERHEAELRVEMPQRQEKRQRAADKRLEGVLAGEGYGSSPRERRAARLERRTYERFLAGGGQVYEKRIISRTDGQGGYEVPPLWLVDEYIEYLRAGRTMADLWHNFPLPTGTDSINIPRLTLGTATGTQPGDGAPVPGREITDNFVQARVMTVAGQQDAAMQILDQSPLNYDEIIFGDLTADYNMQVSAQLMLGAGFPQLNGLYQTGVLGTSVGKSTSGFITQATGTTTAQWTGAASVYTAAAQLVSQLSRNRFLPPTGLVTNPAVWYAMNAATDTQGRPLVVPVQQGANFNQAAAADTGAQTEGLVGHILSQPWWIDPNIPLTFGGTGATQPYIGAISNGHTAPFDGSGGTSTNANVFTPLIAARWADLFFWEGDMRTRVLQEVLSSTLAVRFQVYAYCASMPNRYQDASGNLVSYGNANSVGTLGAALSQGTAGGLINF